MQSQSAIENPAQVRGRRRKRGSAAADGPVFVDTSGRRARLLSRIGLLVGVVCLGYAVVLGMAFMGWGTSLTPSSLLPFDGGRAGSAPTAGYATGYGTGHGSGYGAGHGGPRGGAASGDVEPTLPAASGEGEQTLP
ncbi:hypothetical protein [Streptomyces sp. NPDC002516]